MTGEERRSQIINEIINAKNLLSGTMLAKKFDVSRQVIVQDVALLRAAGYDIISTSRGYLLQKSSAVKRCFHVKHTDSQIEDELNTIVDMGGKVLDVYVEHDVYGCLRAEMSICSRRNVKEFLERISSGEAKPLNQLTSGKHWHTVEADSEHILDIIEEALKKKGYLLA